MDASPTPMIEAPGLRRKIGVARAALAWEALWPRLVPLLAFVALFVAAAHLDLFAGLEPWTHTALLAVLALAVAGLGWWELRDFAWPTHEAAIRRLERDSGVPHRPLVAVQDRLAAGTDDPMAAALWQAHRRREVERLAGLANRPAHPGLAALDTWALRLVPVLLLIVAVVTAGGWRGDRMMAAVTPAFPPPPPVVANLWIAPPAYTGRPPVYLDVADRDKVLRVPVGSKLAGFVDDVRGRKPPQLVIDGKATEFTTVGKGKYQIEQVITEGKQIGLKARGDEQARWKLHVIPDLPPTIEFARPIGVDKWSTKIEYIAGDDFGVTGVQLQIRLHGSVLGDDALSSDEEPEVLRIDLPVAGNTKKVSDSFVRDLTSHPWAGLKVTVMLFATDAIGQKGRSSVETFLLPERVFNDPTARALIVLRKALTRDPAAFRADVADGMRMIQIRPEDYRNDPVVQLGLRIGAARLAQNGDKENITETQKLLWDLAMRLESGATSDAERALEQARQELRDAVQRQAGDEEIERLIQQLYDAMARWQRELAEKMKDPEERRRMEEQAEKMDPNSTITGDDLQKMLDKIREMAKNGDREGAKRLLEELRKMMENATPMMAQPGQQRQQGQQRGQQGQGNQQGREMMNQLDRLSRRENQLLGEAEREGLRFKEAGAKAGGRRRHEPDWRLVHKELKRKHVTLQILWDEYIEQHPEGYRYSRFCEIYREWEAKLSLSMRQTYLGGEKLFVDYAGDTVAVIIDRHTGETRPAHIFVAVIGASSLTYAEATWTEGLADWLGAHTRAFSFIGGSPKLVVPDNPKVAVIKACFYEPMVNRTYEDMLSHYGTAALPARPRKPKDKAKV